MRAYTLVPGGVLEDGIPTEDGQINLGLQVYGPKPMRIPLDPRATVTDGRLREAPGVGALVLLRDQSGTFGSWHLRAAQPEARWDEMLAAETIPNALDRILATERIRARFPHRPPVGWYEFARGSRPPPIENGRPLTDLYGYLEEGAAIEIRRRGALNGTPSVYRLACVGGGIIVSNPKADAEGRRDWRSGS